MLRIYDEFLEDETILSLKALTYKLHVSSLIYCSRNLTDGVLTDRGVKVVQAILGYPLKRHVAELVAAGVWEQIDGGYRIRNYLEFNPDAETVKREKAQARERMRKLREKRASSASPTAEGSGEQSGERALPPQSSPVHAFGKPIKAVTANQEIEHEIDKLLKHIKGSDDGTRGVLLSIGRKLPVGCIAKVRESCMSRTVSPGYAVNALKSELAELEEVA